MNQNRNKKFWLFISLPLILLIGISIFDLLRPSSKIKQTLMPTKEIKWQDLAQLNYKTGEAPDTLKALNGRKVKLPGFIVPLDDNFKELTEFLLVPNAQACIHVPPPPPNLIVHVKLPNPIPVKQVHNPSWIFGTLKIVTTKSKYGNSSYQMTVDRVEKYNYQ